MSVRVSNSFMYFETNAYFLSRAPQNINKNNFLAFSVDRFRTNLKSFFIIRNNI